MKKIKILLILTLLLAFLTRFYNFSSRIYVHSDDALFVQGAYYAFTSHQFPLIGPFAQAPFFTGPWWLWFLELQFPLPFGPLTPWYFWLAISLGQIYLFYYLGSLVLGRKFGLVLAFLAAIAPGLIDNSLHVWNAAADSILSLLALILLVRIQQKSRLLEVFLLGFCLSVAVTIHFQNSLLLPIFFLALIFLRRNLLGFPVLIFGALAGCLPLLYFDTHYSFFESRRLFDYLTVVQYRNYVPNRWLTYLTVYWPNSWAYITGLPLWAASGMLLLLLPAVWWARKNKGLLTVFAAFLLSLILFRYYRGERLIYYSNFAQSYVLILTAWIVYLLAKVKFVSLIMAVFLAASFFGRSGEIFSQREIALPQIMQIRDELYKNFPDSYFQLYGCSWDGQMYGHMLGYLLYRDGRENKQGINLGICWHPGQAATWQVLKNSDLQTQLDWKSYSSNHVYKSMTQWYLIDPPSWSKLY